MVKLGVQVLRSIIIIMSGQDTKDNQANTGQGQGAASKQQPPAASNVSGQWGAAPEEVKGGSLAAGPASASAVQLPGVIGEMEVVATTLAMLLKETISEPKELLGEYARNIEKHAAELSAQLDQLPKDRRAKAINTLFGDILKSVADKVLITEPSFTEDIVSFFHAIVGHILPLRMHDIVLLKIVNDIIFEGSSKIYNLFRQNGYSNKWKFGQATARKPMDYLNEICTDHQKKQDLLRQHEFVVDKGLYIGEGDRFDNWRDALKAGDYIDVNKFTEVRVNNSKQKTSLFAWKRAKIMKVIKSEEETEAQAIARCDQKAPMPRTFTVCYCGEPAQPYSLKAASVSIAPMGMHTNAWEWRMNLNPGDKVDLCDEFHVWYHGHIVDRRVAIGALKGVDCDEKPICQVKVGFRYHNDEFGVNKDKDGFRYIGFNEKFDAWFNVSDGSIMPPWSITTPFISVVDNLMSSQKNSTVDKEDRIYLTNTPETPYEFTAFRKDNPIKQGDWQQRIKIEKVQIFPSGYRSKSFEYKNYTNDLAKEAFKLDRMIFMLESINEFGRRGGFNKVLEIMSSFSNPDVTLDIHNLIQIMRFIVKTGYHYHRQFLCWFVPRLQEAWLSGVVAKNSKANQMCKDVTVSQWKIVSDSYESILKRYFVDSLISKHLAVGEVQLSIAGLQQENLEKRITSIKILDKQIKGVESTKEDNRDKSFLQTFKDNNIFHLLFSPQFYHAEIVKRAGEIFKIYVKYDGLTSREVEQLWFATYTEASVKLDIYKLLTDAGSVLDAKIMTEFIERVKTKDPEKIDIADLEFLCNLSKSKFKSEGPREAACNVLWDIATLQRSGYQKDILKPAREQLITLIKAQEREQKDEFSMRCVSIIGGGDVKQSSVQAIAVLVELLKSIAAYSSGQRVKNKKEQVIHLVKECELMDRVFKDLDLYIKQVVADPKLKEDNVETIEIGIDKFSHTENLEIRIECILFLLETGDGKVVIEEHHLNQLHNNLLTQTKLNYDKEKFFGLFRKLLQKKKTWIDTALVQKFFEEKVQADPELVHGVEEDGFTVISQIFLQVNEIKGFIDTVSNPEIIEEKKATTSYGSASGYGANYGNSAASWHNTYPSSAGWSGGTYSSTTYSYGNTQPKSTAAKKEEKKLDFRVFVKPEQLEGMQIIWSMFEHATVNNPAVNKNLMSFLSKIYQSSSENSDDEEKAQVYSAFINECFARMKAQNNPVMKSKLVKRTLYMWRNFFAETEKQGTMLIRQHNTLDCDTYMVNKLLVKPTGWWYKDAPEYFLFNVESTMTLWELYDHIGKYLKKSPLQIILERKKGKNDKQYELKSEFFCQTLAQLSFGDNEEITVKKRDKTTVRAPLINQVSGKLTRQAETIFDNWFAMYATPDEIWEKVFTKKNAADWFQSCQKKAASAYYQAKITEYSWQVSAMFRDFDEDRDNKINRDNFLEFMRDQCKKKSSDVWDMLTAQRIGNDLRPITENAQYDDDQDLTTDISMLPRMAISNNQEQLNALFSLGEGMESDTIDMVWKTISMLKTNKEMYMNVLENDDDMLEGMMQADVLDKIPINKLVYQLQIVKSLIKKVLRGITISSNDELNIYFEKPAPVEEEPQDGVVQEEAGAGDGAAGAEEEKKAEGADNMIDSSTSPNKGQKAGDGIEEEKKGGEERKGGEEKKDGEETKEDAAAPVISEDFRKVRAWKGEIRKTKIDHSLFGTDELKQMLKLEGEMLEDKEIAEQLCTGKFKGLHEVWLIQFLVKGGFKALMNILNAFIAKSKGNANDLNNAESLCVRLVSFILKVILVGCFSVDTADADASISTTLLKKMSSNNADGEGNLLADRAKRRRRETLKKEEQDKLQATKQTYCDEDYSHLVSMLENAPDVALTHDLVMELDCENLLEMLQTLFEMVLRKKSDNKDQVGIVEEGLNIWTALVTYNSSLLESMYGTAEVDEDLPPWEEQAKPEGGQFVKVLVDHGLLASETAIRHQFKEALLFVCLNVNKTDLAEQPATFFLRMLLDKLKAISEIDPMNTEEYFNLFSQLMQEYFRRKSVEPGSEDIFEETGLLHEVLGLLMAYKSRETKDNSQDVNDCTLVGLLSITTDLLEGANQKGLEVFQANQAHETTDLILNKLLFGDSKLTEASLALMTAADDLKIFETASGYKCHHRKSREAAYDLFLFLVEHYLSPDEFDRLIRLYWTSIIMKVDKPANALYDPANHRRCEYDYAGLVNLGATCYMNSMLQQFFNVPIFRYSLMAAHDAVAPSGTDHQGRKIDDNLLHQWQRLFSTLQLTDRKAYNTRDFCYSYKDAGQPVDVKVQQDASEFLNVAFDRLEYQLKKSQGEKYLCQNVFQGEKSDLKVCGGCGYRKESPEEFYLLSVQVKDKNDIYSGLKNMTAGEIINDFYCEQCQQKVDLTKKTAIKRLPNTLIVHLNRIVFDMETFNNVKVNDRFEFPTALNLRPYMVSEVNKQDDEEMAMKKEQEDADKPEEEQEKMARVVEEKDPSKHVEDEDEPAMIDTAVSKAEEGEEGIEENKKGEDDEEADEIPDSEFEYKLVGVVIHMGSATAGHYISYINIEREGGQAENWSDPALQRWLEFNDTIIKDFDAQAHLEEKCFGSKDEKGELSEKAKQAIESGDFSAIPVENNHNAYMLVYEKRTKVPFKIDVDKALVESIKANTNRATMEDSLPDCFRIYPDLFSQVQTGEKMFYDPAKNEHYALVDQNHYNKFVPVRSKIDVLWDNNKYLTEKQVLSSSFYETTTALFEKVITNLEQRSKTEDISKAFSDMFKILDRLIFDLILNSKDLSSLTQLNLQLLRVAFSNEDTFQRLIQNRIFRDPRELGKDEKNFFEIMVKHQHAEVRQMASDILQHVFARTFVKVIKAEGDLRALEEMLNKVWDGVMLMMTLEVHKFFWKSEPIFDFFKTLICDPKEGEQNKLPFIGPAERKEIRRFFRQKGLVGHLLALCAKYQPNDIYGNENSPPFYNVVTVISILVRHQPLFNYTYEMEEQPTTNALRLMWKADKSLASPFFSSSEHLEQMMHDDNVDQLDFLSEEDIHCLYMMGELNTNSWVKKFLVDEYNSLELAQLLAHLCWKNEEMSRRVGKCILLGCNMDSWKELKPALACAQFYLSIQDEYQQKRIEWLLGFPDFAAKEPPYSYNYAGNITFSQLKTGAHNIQKTTDCTYTYSSGLFKDQKGDRDTFLTNIYKFRWNRIESPILMFNCLMEMLSNGLDRNNAILKYLLTIPGPNVNCARYWDWMEPFVSYQIQKKIGNDDKKNKAADDEHLALWLSINEMMQKIKEAKEDLMDDISNPATHLLLGDGPGGARIFEPYLIWETKKANVLSEKKDDQNDIGFQIAELTCDVSRSVPTGEENLCLQQREVKQYYTGSVQYSVMQIDKEGKPIGTTAVSSAGTAGYQNNRKRGKGGKKGKNNKNKKKQTLVMVGSGSENPNAAQSKAAAPTNEESKDEEKKNDGAESDEGDSDELDYEPVKFQVDTDKRNKLPVCLCIVLRNHTYSQTKNIRISWNYALKEVLNFRLPVTDWIVKVPQKKSKIAITFTKIHPEEDWGPIEDLMAIMPYEPARIRMLSRVKRPRVGGNAGGRNDAAAAVPGTGGAWASDAQGGSAFDTGASTNTNTTDKACQVCTVTQSVHNARCEVCDTPFP